MEFNFYKLPNKRKTLRTLVFAILTIPPCLIWFEDILQWDRGRGVLFLLAGLVGVPIQALFYGYKWHKERVEKS